MMTKGFGGFVDNGDNKAKIIINQSEVDNLLKKYKKIKKYQKSSLFAVKTMDGTEDYISKMVEEAKDTGLYNE